MKRLMTVVLGVMFAIGLGGMAIAGSIDSSGAPSGGSGMYTLSQIYDYLNSGIKSTPVPSFQEPNVAPGPTMKTLKQIYEDHMAMLDQCNITAENVELGKIFFCTQAGNWGVQTGTGLMQPTPTITPTIPPTPTPTSTPIPWGPTACAGVNGTWGSTQIASPSEGCWIEAAGLQNCGVTCSNKSYLGVPLNCQAGNINDDGSCSICRAMHPNAGCDSNHTVTLDPIYRPSDNYCFQRNTSARADACGIAPGGLDSNYHLLCVCKP